MYYGRKFKTKEELIKAINDYMDYYVNRRVQRRLGVMTPAECRILSNKVGGIKKLPKRAEKKVFVF